MLHINDNVDMLYQHILYELLSNGLPYTTRGNKCLGVEGWSFGISINNIYNAPLLSSRVMYPKGVIGELVTFLQKPKTVQQFKDNNCNYWDDWGDDDGNITLDYGNIWYDFNGFNQLEYILSNLNSKSSSRRLILSNWNPAHIDVLSLPCCHVSYQWIVRHNKITFIMNQRSCDVVLGLPSNIFFCYLLNTVLMVMCGMEDIPLEIIFQVGDLHIYEEHMSETQEYLRNFHYSMIKTHHVYYTNRDIKTVKQLPNISIDDFIIDYEPIGRKYNYKLIV